MRLIDADALIPIMKYTTTDNEIGVFPIRIGFEDIKGVIDEAPTIDTVEIVHCKDCEFCIVEEPISRGIIPDVYCRIWESNVSTDDYCSYGERKLKKPDDSLVREDSDGVKEQKSKLEHDLVYRGEAEATDTDLISRQAAIEAVEKAVFKGVAKSAIESLPPVEPKPDLVNRSDVLELAKSGVLISNDNYKKVCEAINGLPSCHTCRECEPVEPKPVCEDAISRQEILRAIIICEEVDDDLTTLYEVVEKFPPVEPKRPKTTETMMVDGEPTEIDPLSYEVGYTHGQFSDRPKGECRTCKWCSDHCCETDEDFTRCPIEEHYRLPKDGYCHLYQHI